MAADPDNSPCLIHVHCMAESPALHRKWMGSLDLTSMVCMHHNWDFLINKSKSDVHSSWSLSLSATSVSNGDTVYGSGGVSVTPSQSCFPVCRYLSVAVWPARGRGPQSKSAFLESGEEACGRSSSSSAALVNLSPDLILLVFSTSSFSEDTGLTLEHSVRCPPGLQQVHVGGVWMKVCVMQRGILLFFVPSSVFYHILI